MSETGVLAIAREILAPVVGAAAGFLAAHGLALSPDQQAAAVTLGATGVVALERWVMRIITPKPLPPPHIPPPPPAKS